jgi:NSS family neurotransmitter:Na+ symporter
MSKNRENWGSRLGFILAAAGSAIGLGNLWRFPYITGENGGGIFIFVYIICIFVIGIPIMLAEMTIGRYSQRNPVGAFKVIKPGTPWFLVGGMGVLAGCLIFSFYSVVAGWTLGYVFESLRGALKGMDANQISAHFDKFSANAGISILYFIVMIVLTVLVVSKGIKAGIERWSKILMPALFVMLILIMIRSLAMPGAWEGVKFIFWPDFSKLDPSILMKAMGQAFFSLSLGIGVILTYGSYLSKNENMPLSSGLVCCLDLLASLLGGLALFPALFAFKMSPQQGTGLAFKTLPVIFTQIPLGSIVMAIFFILLFVAALTSTISMLEIIVSYFIDEKKWSRGRAAWTVGIVTIFLGIPSALSAGILSSEKIGFSPMEIINHLTADYMLPLGALFFSLFVGFAWKRNEVLNEVRQGYSKFFLAPVWLLMLRFLAPFIVGQILFLGFIREFASLRATVDKISNMFSLIDAVLVSIFLVAAAFYVIGIKKAKVS